MEVVSSLPTSKGPHVPFIGPPFKSTSGHPRSTSGYTKGPPPSTGHFRSTATGHDVMRMRILG